MIIAAGRLEGTIRRMAADLLVYPGKHQPSELLKEITKAARAGLPAHSRIGDSRQIVDWATESHEALYERHVPAHSSAAARMHDGEFEPVLIHLRSGEVSGLNEEALLDAADRIKKLHVSGEGFVAALRHEPRRGVYLPNAVLDDAWVPTCNAEVGGADMARPTEAELDERRQRLGPFPSLPPANN